jgi:hypothetical protein
MHLDKLISITTCDLHGRRVRILAVLQVTAAELGNAESRQKIVAMMDRETRPVLTRPSLRASIRRLVETGVMTASGKKFAKPEDVYTIRFTIDTAEPTGPRVWSRRALHVAAKFTKVA